MSINCNNPINEDAAGLLRELYGKPFAEDEKTMLFDNMRTVVQADMSAVAKAAGQPVTVELHSEGDIKTLSDGTRYLVTPKGWLKLEDPA